MVSTEPERARPAGSGMLPPFKKNGGKDVKITDDYHYKIVAIKSDGLYSPSISHTRVKYVKNQFADRPKNGGPLLAYDSINHAAKSIFWKIANPPVEMWACEIVKSEDSEAWDAKEGVECKYTTPIGHLPDGTVLCDRIKIWTLVAIKAFDEEVWL